MRDATTPELLDLLREDADTSVEVRCRCGSKWLHWRRLGRVDLSWTLAELGARMRCRKCGCRPGSVAIVRQRDQQGYVSTFRY